VTTTAGPLFGFVQVEYPWPLGPADGRYVLRGHAGVPTHVLMLATLGATEHRALRRRAQRKPRSAAPAAPPTPVVTARATLVTAEPFGSRAEAESWRSGVDGEAEAARALRVLNRVLHAHRVAAADPYVRDLHRDAALVVRVGAGEGEALAHGRWTNAVELAPRSPSRAAARSSKVLRPQERLAAVLGGRDVALACEELTLRARADVDAGRMREAALQLRVALECALAELAPWADRDAIARRTDELCEERATIAAGANAAIRGGLAGDTAGEIVRVLELLEAALRTRSDISLE
jgi:hypothetical protein